VATLSDDGREVTRAGADRRLLETLSASPPAQARRVLLDWVRSEVATFLGLPNADEITARDSFLELGFDSLRAVDFKILLERKLLCGLRSTLLFDHPTPDALARHLADEHLSLPAEGEAPVAAPDVAAAEALDVARLSPEEAKILLARTSVRLRELERRRTEPIAVVGMACRFPGGANSPQQYWDLLRDGRDAITEIPRERWELERYYSSDRNASGKMYTRHGGYIEGIDRFDAAFFGISPREAAELDPQQRLLLETAWECLESAGQSPDALHGSDTGVYIGLRESEYFNSQSGRSPEEVGTYYGTGNALSTAAGRISYVLGLKGPNLALDTACSSSLLAVHLACQSLRRGESAAALAGGVNALLDPISNVALCRASMVSPQGRCKTFDAAADGYVRAEGCGLILLKPLSRALADGDRIFALIRGTAANQDGASGGLTVPHGPSQEAVIRRALADGSLAPYQVGYIEAHGTGTSLGDPIEVGALDAVFGSSRLHGAPLVVGSVKTNIGHLETAAGIAGLIKVILSLQNEMIPRQLHLKQRNPHIAWERTVVKVPTEPIPWPRGAIERVAGVSSFGFSGTNVHVVLSEAPPAPRESETAARGAELVVLSAGSDAALTELCHRWSSQISVDGANGSLADWAYCAARGRAALPYRLSAAVANREELAAILQKECAAAGSSGVPRGRAALQELPVALLFTGQGSQRAGMGRELDEAFPAFRRSLDRAAAVLDPRLGIPLRSLLWGEHSDRLGSTRYTQPALAAFELALFDLWDSIGLRPSAVLGHSIGEIAAAAAAGILEPEEALLLAEARGRLMDELTRPGAMAAVTATPDAIAELARSCGAEVTIAAENGPVSVTVSSEHAQIDRLVEALRAQGIVYKKLQVSHAFHSPMMEPMLAAFGETVSRLRLHAPRLRFVSCLRPGGMALDPTQPSYWVEHVRRTVQFRAGIEELAAVCRGGWCEVGPAPVLLGMARRFVVAPILATVASVRPAESEVRSFLRAAGELWVRGAALRPAEVHRGLPRTLVEIPKTPFDRRRHWLERKEVAPRGAASAALGRPDPHPMLGSARRSTLLGPSEHLYESSWSESSPPWMSEHRVFGKPLVPGAAYLETLLAAARRALRSDAVELRSVVVQAPMALSQKPAAVEIHISPAQQNGETTKRWSARIYSLRPDEESAPWVEHASAVAMPLSAELRSAMPQAAPAGTAVDLSALRAALADAGLEYGPAFQGLQSLHIEGDAGVARVALPEGLDASEYVVHPALLDACFQATGALLQAAGLEGTYLPIAARRITSRRAVGAQATCRLLRRSGTGGDRTASLDLELCTSQGDVALEIRGLTLARASRAAMQRALGLSSELLYGVEWINVARGAAHSPPTGSVLVAGDDPAVDDLCALILASGLQPIRGDSPLPADLRGAVLFGSPGEMLPVVQRLLASAQAAPPKLLLVSRGAFATYKRHAEAPDAHAAALSGFAATLALEHPELDPRHVDLLPLAARTPRDIEVQGILQELWTTDREMRVARRGERRYAPRLAPIPGTAKKLKIPTAPAFALRSREWGALENLDLVPMERRPPGPGEVEIEVEAASLNFKDSLYAMGLLREDAQKRGITAAVDQPLGFDAAGRVVAVGAGVTRWRVGDEVLAWCFGALASHATAPEFVVTRRPRGLTAAQSAALPTVMLTAVYGLLQLAKLRQGQTILIHAAAGGLGQAALAIARRAGATVLATASPHKFQFLNSQGVEDMWPSRVPSFSYGVMQETHWRGADVVLHSLGSEAAEESLASVAPGGVFLEVGRLGALDEARAKAMRPDVQFYAFDTAEVISRNPQLFTELFEEIHRGYDDGSLRPLPVTMAPLTDAVGAFTDLARGRTTGKVILTIPKRRADGSPQIVPPERTCLITGGLGALGLESARRLAEEGARFIALLSRRAPDAAQQARMASIEATGARVFPLVADASDRDALARALAALRDAGAPPVGSVLHAAGVLEDGMILHQSPERFVQAARPKIDAAIAVIDALSAAPPEVVIFYSSMAGLLGSAGQSPYSSANSSLDALAAALRTRGIRALSVAWGPWAGEGMAAAVAARNAARFSQMGLSFLEPEAAWDALRAACAEEVSFAAVLPVRWPAFLAALPREAPAFLARVVASAPQASRESAPPMAKRLAEAPPELRRDLLRSYLTDELARVLGFPQGQAIDGAQPFVDLGVDSLLSVDYRNRLERALERSLPATLLFEQPTLDALLLYLLGAQGAAPADPLAARVAEMSDAEVERLLASEEGGARPL